MEEEALSTGQRFKEIVLNLGVMMFGLLLASLMGELVVRVAVPAYRVEPHPRGLYVIDEDLGYALARNFTARHRHAEYDVMIETNGDGFRGPEIVPEAHTCWRVLVLGDSIAWGYGVGFEESFPRQLEIVLEQLLSTPVCVVNAAVPGYGTEQELGLLKKWGLDYEPDLVILGFFVENDVYDNLVDGAARRTVRRGYLVDSLLREQLRRGNPLAILTGFLSRNSRLYVLLRSYLRAFLIHQGQASARFQVGPLPGLSEQTPFPVFADDPGPQIEKGMAKTLSLIGEIAATGDAHGARTVVALLPSKLQVEPDLWNEMQQVYQLNGDAYSLTKPNEIIAEYCTQQGIPVIDLLSAFRESAAEKVLYYRTDLHQNAAGQALAAKEVAKGLLQQGVGPR